MIQSIFVTGAGRGLGLETCKIFYSNGWNVAGIATSVNSINNLKKFCPNAEGYICDIKDASQVEKVLEDANKKFSGLDVLLNNVGIKGKGKLEDFSAAEIEKIIATNLTGAINATKEAIKIMKKQGYGKIINVSSTSGIETAENFSIYCATKHGLTGFSKAIMKECLDYNINVSIIYPGGMQTDFHDSPRPLYLPPREVAEAIYFIATRPQDILVSELVIVPKCERKYLR